MKAQVAFVGPGPDEGGLTLQLSFPNVDDQTKADLEGLELGYWVELEMIRTASPEPSPAPSDPEQ